uniref:Elongation of very long chain fatty acids protein n=2 Tax=Ixodes ricinus TaxID=34613 RepID=V5H8Q2_IXORI
MGSPLPIVALLSFYLLFALHLGPRLMRNRQPFNIRRLVVAYNVAMVCMSLYFIYVSVEYAKLRSEGSLLCWPSDPRPSDENMYFLHRAWYYMLMKAGGIAGHAVLRPPQEGHPPEFLAHSSPLPGTLVGLVGATTLGLTGHGLRVPDCSNSAVHVVMYGYYASRRVGAELRRKPPVVGRST